MAASQVRSASPLIADGATSPAMRAVIPLAAPARPATMRHAIAGLLLFVSGAAAMSAVQAYLPQSSSQMSTPSSPTAEAVQESPTMAAMPTVALPAVAAASQPASPPTTTISTSFEVTGTLEPAPGRYARLPLATSQAVAFVDVKPGDRVKKGWQVFSHWESPDRLQAAKLELEKTRKRLEVAQSYAEAAEKTAARLRKLKGQVTAQELQDDETAANIRRQEAEAAELAASESESRFAALEFEFNQAFVTAPIDGVVAAVDVVVGERRQVGNAFRGVAILDPRVLECHCLLDSQQLACLSRLATNREPGRLPNVQATIDVDGTPHPASVTSIGIMADARGLVPVVLEVQNDDEILRSGTRVAVNFSGRADTASP